MGFWCVEDLLKAGRTDEKVLIVPIGIQYRYVNPPWQPLEKLLTQLEIDCGLPALDRTDIAKLEAENLAPEDQHHKIQYLRLIRLGSHLLAVMEQFYARFYHRNLQLKTDRKSVV